MKVTSILFALLVATSFSYGADAEKKADKPKVDPAAAFAKKDANSDGKVSKEEFLKGAKDAAKAEAAFAAKDKDKDGSLSKEEFTAAGGKKKKDK
jgi:Ca2+-binding EF-hand superfamily protein